MPLVRDVRVEAQGGERPTELGKLELKEAGVVEGVVVDEHGDPVPGARVGEGTVPTYLPVAKVPEGIAVCDAQGRFHLEELAEGAVTLEAYAPDFGRARKGGVRVLAGRTTDGVRITLARSAEASSREPIATGGVAITLGQTAAGLHEAEIVVAAVSEGSEAERAGLARGDVLVSVGGEPVRSMAGARARLSGPVHDDVLVKVRRGERTLTLRVAREPVRR